MGKISSKMLSVPPPTRPPVMRHNDPSKSKIVLSIVDEIKFEEAGKAKGPSVSPTSSPSLSSKALSSSTIREKKTKKSKEKKKAKGPSVSPTSSPSLSSKALSS